MENAPVAAPDAIVACVRSFVASVRSEWEALAEPLAKSLGQEVSFVEGFCWKCWTDYLLSKNHEKYNMRPTSIWSLPTTGDTSKANPLEVSGDILVLAGDIGYLGDANYSMHPFWDWASDNYKQVIACMGNHEFYKYYDIGTLSDGSSIEIRPNVHSYYNGVIRIGDIDIIVSTLWSRIPLGEAYFTEQVVSDFHRILYKGELLTFADFNHEHERCLSFIKEAVKSSNARKKVVVTHHVPLIQDAMPQVCKQQKPTGRSW